MVIPELIDHGRQCGYSMARQGRTGCVHRIQDPWGCIRIGRGREHVQRLNDAGADEIKLNLQCSTRELFSRICPDLDYDGIRQRIVDAVEIFGRGRVVINIIYGFGETDEELYDAIRGICELGAIPTVRALRINKFNRSTLEGILGAHTRVAQEGHGCGSQAEGDHGRVRVHHEDQRHHVPGMRMLRSRALQGPVISWRITFRSR